MYIHTSIHTYIYICVFCRLPKSWGYPNFIRSSDHGVFSQQKSASRWATFGVSTTAWRFVSDSLVSRRTGWLGWLGMAGDITDITLRILFPLAEDGDFMEILKIPSSSVTWLEPGLWVLKDLVEATLDRTWTQCQNDRRRCREIGSSINGHFNMRFVEDMGNHSDRIIYESTLR